MCDNAASYLPPPHSTWNIGVIPLEHIGASLPPSSEDPRLIFVLLFLTNFKTVVHQCHIQMDGRMMIVHQCHIQMDGRLNIT